MQAAEDMEVTKEPPVTAVSREGLCSGGLLIPSGQTTVYAISQPATPAM